MAQSLSFDVRGTGPGLVLLHGTGSTGLASWGPVLPGLAAEYTIVLPNLPGSGASPSPDRPLDPDTVADQIVAAAQEAGLDRFALVGGSLGAPIAVRVAARHPHRITKLATVVGYAAPRPILRINFELYAAMFDRRDTDTGKLLVSLLFSDRYLAGLPAGVVDRMISQLGVANAEPGTAAQIDFARRLDVRADLASIQAPTLVLATTGDRFIAPTHSYELAAGIPGARLVEIEGGHAVILEDPPRTLSALLDFLRG